MATDRESIQKSTYIRLATKSDVPLIKRMVEELAVYEKSTDQCHITEGSLESALFSQPAFSGPTCLLLELGPPLSTNMTLFSASEDQVETNFKFEHVPFCAEIEDPEALTFKSPLHETRTVAGYVLFYPTFSTYVGGSGVYIVDLYVREAYRRKGLGKILLKTVAHQATLRGWRKVEWCVLDWNKNAIQFYESMGAKLHQELRICRLTGDSLKSYSSPSTCPSGLQHLDS